MCDDRIIVFECRFLVIYSITNAVGVPKFYRAKPKGAKLCNKFLVSEDMANQLIENAKKQLYIEQKRREEACLDDLINAQGL